MRFESEVIFYWIIYVCIVAGSTSKQPAPCHPECGGCCGCSGRELKDDGRRSILFLDTYVLHLVDLVSALINVVVVVHTVILR